MSMHARLPTDDASHTAGETTRPSFSVVLISYNQLAYVRAAVASVLSNTAASVEVLCVDDGSIDGTVDVLRELARSDSRVRVLAQPHSGRPAVMRNVGLDAARGEYVCFLDGDDLYHHDKLSALGAVAMASAGADVIFHDYADFVDGSDPAGAPPRIRRTPIASRLEKIADRLLTLGTGDVMYEVRPIELVQLLLCESFVINTVTACVRRQHLVDLGVRFPEDRVLGEDNVVWLTCVRSAAAVAYVDRVLAYWRKRPGSLTHTRTPTTQRELVRSMHEYLDVVRDTLPPSTRAAVRRRILEETVEIGWLLEREGAWWSAVREYVRAAIELRTMAPVWRAAKALARRESTSTRQAEFLREQTLGDSADVPTTHRGSESLPRATRPRSDAGCSDAG